jgi:hypothetical protein
MSPFDSKQFEVKREDQAIAKWVGAKDDATLAKLLTLFRSEGWRGQLVINYPGNGGVNDVIFTERKARRVVEDAESLPYEK